MKKVRIKINHILLCNVVVAGFLLLSFGTATAQEGNSVMKKEVSVYAKGGLNYLHYNLKNGGKQDNGFEPGIGIQYSQYLNTNWSVSGGLEYQRYSSEAVLTGFTDQYSTADNEGDDFVFKYSAGSYTEKHWVDMLNIPIRVQYETNGSKNRLYASVGFQYGIPLTSKYNGAFSNLKTSGYYEQWNAELESPAFMGFGTWGDKQFGDTDLKIKNNYALLFEIGVNHQFNDGNGLHIGLYGDFGLNNLVDSESLPLLNYDANNPTEFGIQSVLKASPNAQGSTYAGKVRAIGLGLKLRYVFNLEKKSDESMQ